MNAAKIFADEWYELGDEKSDTQKFWLTFLRDVFDIARPEKIIDFEISVPNGFIDAYIPSTKVLIEQKSFGVDLTKKILQSDGKFLTPYEQAVRYAQALDEPPRRIVTCNFSEFRIYKPGREEPTVIKLRDLRYQFPRLKFLIDPKADDTPPEEKISAEAAKIIENICLAFDKNYRKREPAFRDALSKLCTRLVFCFYADDANIFGEQKFGDYLNKFPPEKIRDALQKFFGVLNTPEDKRDAFDDELKKFPFVNGGLFAEKFSIPPIDTNLKLTITRAHILKVGFTENVKFSWREISPPIFGAMFESILNDKTRRTGGMHYTSAENIHKVIDPLFLDDLRDELELAKRKQIKNRAAALLELQEKISSLKFFDPACGSGNFLTETYLSLRRLENEILEELHGLKVELPDDPIKVSIKNFFGIEIDSFAAAVAQTALWIAENQMLQETEGALGKNLQALPLKNYPNILCANALRVDWKSVFKVSRLVGYEVSSKNSANLPTCLPDNLYIIGNPPFVGFTYQSPEQKADLQKIFRGVKNLDYVCCWFKKASDFIQGSKIRCAFVATNSVTQGETVARLWKFLNVHIDFAHRTFKWLSDSENPAHVHCVVVGFSCAENPKPKIIFDGKKIFIAQNINAYLIDGENIFVESRNSPLQDGVPKMITGNRPADGGNLIIEPDDLEKFSDAKKFIKRLVGAEEFIRGKKRFCLWLKDFPLDEIKKFPLVAERVEACRRDRLAGAPDRKKLAETPHLFREIRQPTTNYILVPRHSSENRAYVPIDFLPPEIIASDATLIVPDAEIFHFGILTSSIHMAWTKTFCGRLEMRYRYSAKVVYNNFPWPAVNAEQKELIVESAQKILDVRKKFSDWTLAKLYDEETMPQALRSAHKWNDYNVALAYGFEKIFLDEAKIAAELMKLYKRLAEGEMK